MRAVLERDYVAESARPRGFAARGLLGATAALLLLVTVFRQGGLEGQDWDRVGASVFALLGAALFGFLVVTLPLLLVGSLLSERLRNTLEILVASPEGFRGVARGKFLARLSTAMTWTAAALPPLTVAVLFGGTSWRQLTNLGLALLGTALELAGWGLVVSAASRKFATAAILVYALPAAHWALEFGQQGPSTTPFLSLLARATTPFPSLDLNAWDRDLGVLKGVGEGLLRYPGLWHLAAGALVALLALPLAERLLAQERVGRDLRFRFPRLRGEGRLRALLTRGNPVAWKESLLLNTAWSRLLYYVVAGVLLAAELWIFLGHERGEWDSASDLRYLLIAMVVIIAMAGVLGAASMAYEKTQGTFDLLRISRLSPGEIARGKFLGTALGTGFLLLIPLGHLALTTAMGVHHAATALVATVAVVLTSANFAVHGLTWGILARSPGAALAGAAALVAFAAGGCSVLCLLPFVLAGLRLFKKEAPTDFFEVIVIPGVLCGSPLVMGLRLVMEQMEGAASRARGMGGVEVGGFAILSALCLVVTMLYLVYRWNRLPEVLEREMARMCEEGDVGAWTAGARPSAPHLDAAAEIARRIRERRAAGGTGP
jgi:ABC-type transport system involved in multi-copper enzyme maturation permease subunit